MPRTHSANLERWDAIEAKATAWLKERGVDRPYKFDPTVLRRHEDAWAAMARNDSALRQDSGFYFARELEAVNAEIMMTEFAENKAANGVLFDVDTFGGAGAKNLIQREHEAVGKARVGGPSTTDPPPVAVIARESSRPVVVLDDSYHFDLEDIARGDMTGEPLDRSLALAAKEAIDQAQDEIAAVGHDAVPEGGIVNNTSVASTTLPNGNWITLAKTADEIIADFIKLKTDASADSDGRAILTDAIIPPEYEMYIDGLRLGDQNVNVLEYIEQRVKIKIHSWHRMKDAGSGGQDVIFAYVRRKDVIKLAIPKAFEALPPQPKNRAFMVNCWQKTGGVIIDKPKYCRRAFLTAS